MSEIEEKTFFSESGVLVSDKRVVLGNKTYALKQITSVARVEIKNGPKTMFGFKLGKVMGWCWFVWIATLIATNLAKLAGVYRFDTIYVIPFILLTLVVILVSISWLFCPHGITHWVEIGSASGKENALLCHTQDEAQKISDAINEAIINN